MSNKNLTTVTNVRLSDDMIELINDLVTWFRVSEIDTRASISSVIREAVKEYAAHYQAELDELSRIRTKYK